MRRFFLALSFLTILPYGAGGQADQRDMSSSTVYYPVVGAVVGALLTFLFHAAGMVFPALLASAAMHVREKGWPSRLQRVPGCLTLPSACYFLHCLPGSALAAAL